MSKNIVFSQSGLQAVALLFIAFVIAIFAIATTVHLPSLMASGQWVKLAIVVFFNLFAGYMLFDAVVNLVQLWQVVYRSQLAEA